MNHAGAQVERTKQEGDNQNNVNENSSSGKPISQAPKTPAETAITSRPMINSAQAETVSLCPPVTASSGTPQEVKRSTPVARPAAAVRPFTSQRCTPPYPKFLQA